MRVNKPKEHYVYAHYLNNNRVYVGKGSGGRLFGATGRTYEYDQAEILMDNLTKSEAFELEKFIINEIGFDNLKNKKTGGWANDPIMKEAASKRMKEYNKNRPKYTMSAESKKKMSEAKKGKKRPDVALRNKLLKTR